MKKLTLILSLLVITVGVKGQSKKATLEGNLHLIDRGIQKKYPNHLDTVMADIANGGTISSASLGKMSLVGTGTLISNSLIWTTDYQKPMLTIDQPKNGWNNKIDSIIIHVNRKKMRWLNDSTAVISK